MKHPTDLAYLLQQFLAEYLPGQRNLSANTIQSYSTTFALLLRYCREERGLVIERLRLDEVTATLLEDFLTWLERTRHNAIATRNQRLAALHAFFRYVQTEAPARVLECQRILALPVKRRPRPAMGYLTVDEVRVILAQPDQAIPDGRRDAVLLSLLYDTGARVQELVDLTVRHIRVETPAVVTLTGKGRKTRHVPLMTRTTALIEAYLGERRLMAPGRLDHPVFYNRQGHKLTRAGITYLVHKYVELARAVCSSLPNTVTPHTFRHSKAMHLLQANVNLIYIRDLLGHTDIRTTEVYARADTEMKRQALEKLQQDVTPTAESSWQEDSELLDWLQNLCRRSPQA